MRKQELDTVRQVLEAALQNLREATAEGNASSESGALFTNRWPSSESRSSDAPVIVIVAGDLKAHSQDPALRAAVGFGDTKDPAKVSSCVSDYTERKLSHPGLERFTIEADPHPSVPKTCFMEPGRTCVNSGACQARGF